MDEDRSISNCNLKLCHIANEVFTLGEKYSETKLVRKMLRSLPDKFQAKVTTIEEIKNVEGLKEEELLRSLQTFEMNMKSHIKEKIIVSYANSQSHEMNDNSDGGKDLGESLAYLTNNFNKI